MSDLDKEWLASVEALEGTSTHFSQMGSIQEPSLNQLRDQIKNVMLPLLIKTFQRKLESTFSSRQEGSIDEAQEQLKTLDQDLKNLLLWSQNCRSQIQKALSLSEQQKSIAATTSTKSHPSISKSFTDAIAKQHLREFTSKTWWKKFFKNRFSNRR
jgi:hypothetical protein